MYGRVNERAIEEFERIVNVRKIQCGFRRLPSYLYTKTVEGAAELKRELAAAKRAGIRASIVQETELPFEVKSGLKYENQAQFHPLEFLSGLVPELRVFEHTRVIKIREHDVFTERGVIRAGRIVLATHFPFVNVPGFYFAKMHQERSYVAAVNVRICENEPDTSEVDLDVQNHKNERTALHGMYYGIDSDGLSFRMAEDLILIGGKSERTGVVQPEDPYQALRQEAKSMWPDCEIVAQWAAQDCMTLDKLPYVGRFSRLRPYWYVATGFEKWGMTNSMIAAMAIRDMITGKENPDWLCVSPQRRLTGKAVRSLMQEIAMTAKNFITFRKPRCPHLGCRLVWNPYERTWDCPCHGSRFSGDGFLIDNPSQTRLKK